MNDFDSLSIEQLERALDSRRMQRELIAAQRYELEKNARKIKDEIRDISIVLQRKGKRE